MQVLILVEIKAKRMDKTFTYNVPLLFQDKVKVGIRVLVPFGKQTLEGFVLEIEDVCKSDYELKDIISIIDEQPIINKEMLELGKFISKNTFSNLISSYQTMLPSALKAKKGFVVNKKYETYLNLQDKDYIPKSDSAKKILNLFKDRDEILKKDANNISISSVKTLINKKIITEIKKEIYRIDNKAEKEVNSIILNEEQLLVVNRVKQNLNVFKPFLLYGVTGSGKTEVYMHIIDEVIKKGKEVIVLVPEISLTPQMVNVFRKRFGNEIAILHSRLNDGEKYDEWRKIERKEVKIVIGARSAIFAPFTNIGIVIIDEEHTSTYKQENTPRYSAIDVALWRCKRYNCPLILGSATPTIESYTRALNGDYELLNMKNRVNNKLPKVELVNMRDEIKKGNRIISEVLYKYINNRLDKKQQVILLLNRRGYSTIMTCQDCGYVVKCPNCDIPLTYHKGINKLKCHYCNYEKKVIDKCPNCNSERFNNMGMGTEKLQQEIEKMFKGCKTIRMDVDTTSRKGSHENIINSFSKGMYDILIGTQMIAKGLDFPNVTLVGVINGDASLNIPDFRSAERTFQLLNQVAGRAGRGAIEGNVVIQGFNIDNYSISLASQHDYINFYKEEIKIRKLLKYPPFCNLAFIHLIGKDLTILNDEGKKIIKFLNEKLVNTIILGPSMANIPKINNIYHMQIIIKYKSLKEIYNYLDYLNNHYKENYKLSVEIDINPTKM